jgi:hypothetical protein
MKKCFHILIMRTASLLNPLMCIDSYLGTQWLGQYKDITNSSTIRPMDKNISESWDDEVDEECDRHDELLSGTNT